MSRTTLGPNIQGGLLGGGGGQLGQLGRAPGHVPQLPNQQRPGLQPSAWMHHPSVVLPPGQQPPPLHLGQWQPHPHHQRHPLEQLIQPQQHPAIAPLTQKIGRFSPAIQQALMGMRH